MFEFDKLLIWLWFRKWTNWWNGIDTADGWCVVCQKWKKEKTLPIDLQTWTNNIEWTIHLINL